MSQGWFYITPTIKQPTNKQPSTTVIGTDNNITGSNTFLNLLGSDNTISSTSTSKTVTNSNIIGNNNTGNANSTYNINECNIIGDYNTVNSNYSNIIGIGNNITGQYVNVLSADFSTTNDISNTNIIYGQASGYLNTFMSWVGKNVTLVGSNYTISVTNPTTGNSFNNAAIIGSGGTNILQFDVATESYVDARGFSLPVNNTTLIPSDHLVLANGAISSLNRSYATPPMVIASTPVSGTAYHSTNYADSTFAVTATFTSSTDTGTVEVALLYWDFSTSALTSRTIMTLTDNAYALANKVFPIVVPNVPADYSIVFTVNGSVTLSNLIAY